MQDALGGVSHLVIEHFTTHNVIDSSHQYHLTLRSVAQ